MNEINSTNATTGKHILPTFIWHAVLSQRYNIFDPDGVLCRSALLFCFLFISLAAAWYAWNAAQQCVFCLRLFTKFYRIFAFIKCFILLFSLLFYHPQDARDFLSARSILTFVHSRDFAHTPNCFHSAFKYNFLLN